MEAFVLATMSPCLPIVRHLSLRTMKRERDSKRVWSAVFSDYARSFHEREAHKPGRKLYFMDQISQDGGVQFHKEENNQIRDCVAVSIGGKSRLPAGEESTPSSQARASMRKHPCVCSILWR